MLTQKDLDEIEKSTKKVIKDEIKFLPTKEEFYKKMDKLIGEIKASREEHTVISGSLSNHSDQLDDYKERIDKLEKIVTP